MISLRKVRVYMRKRNLIPIIDVVQLDTGIRMVLEVADETIPTGSTAKAYFEKPSGKPVEQVDGITVSANTITIDVRNEAFQEAGNVIYQVQLSGSGKSVTTFAGTIHVQRKNSESATQSETVLPALEKATQKAIEDVRREAAELVKTDTTLKLQGKAADSASVGNALTNMKQDLSYLSIYALNSTDIFLESGAFDDNEPNVKVEKPTRLRNKHIISTKNLHIIELPYGYTAYVYLLDEKIKSIGTLSWTNKIHKADLMGATYINMGIRYTDNPSLDLSDKIGLVQSLIKVYSSVDSVSFNLESYIDNFGESVSKGYAKDINRTSLWERGYINSDGTNGSSLNPLSLKRIRTKYYLSQEVCELIILNEETNIVVMEYNQYGTFLQSHRLTGKARFFMEKTKKYRIEMWNDQTTEEITTDYSASLLMVAFPFVNAALIHGYSHDINDEDLWENGYLTNEGVNATGGVAMEKIIRTKGFIPSSVECILCTDTKYLMIVFEYDQNGSFVKKYNMRLNGGFAFSQLKENYKYRVELEKENYSAEPTYVPESKNVLFLTGKLNNKDTFESSLFYRKDIDFGQPPSGIWYKTLGSDYTVFGINSKTSQVYNAIDSLISGHARINKTALGTASDGQTIYEYAFRPRLRNDGAILQNELPKILITTGVHGYEKSSVFGMYYFIRDMLNNWDENPVLDYLKNHVVIRWIPVVNTWGFDNNEYKNKNGVNINRNFNDGGWVYNPDKSAVYYGGEAPHDQPETQVVDNWLDSNKDALYYADYHTNGSGSIEGVHLINWHSLQGFKDDLYNLISKASNYQIRNISAHFHKEFNVGEDMELLGILSTGNGAGGGYTDVYATAKKHIISTTFEGFNGFPNRTPFEPDSQKANAELIGNWIITVINTYKNI